MVATRQIPPTAATSSPSSPSDGGELNRRLLEHYGSHYRRLNHTLVPAEMTAKQRASLERTLGPLITNLPASSQVVDIGCGAGHLLHWISQRGQLELTGVDQSEDQLQIARKSLKCVEFCQEDGLSFLYSHVDTFAGIFCFDVLEHIPGEDNLLAWIEAARSSLRDGGFFCCRCPNGANLLANYSRYIDLTHQRMFTRTSLTQLLEAGGFADTQVVPLRSGWWGGGMRLRVEAGVHRMVYHLCGRRPEPVVTTNVCLVGWRRDNNLPFDHRISDSKGRVEVDEANPF